VIVKFAAAVLVVALFAAARPAFAEGPGPASPLAASAPPPPRSHAGARRAGKIVFAIGVALAIPAAYFLTLTYQHKNDFNQDDGLIYNAYGTILGLSSLATMTTGLVLWSQKDAPVNVSPQSQQHVQLPRGLALRLTF